MDLLQARAGMVELGEAVLLQDLWCMKKVHASTSSLIASHCVLFACPPETRILSWFSHRRAVQSYLHSAQHVMDTKHSQAPWLRTGCCAGAAVQEDFEVEETQGCV
jgi:hypothetical protein